MNGLAASSRCGARRSLARLAAARAAARRARRPRRLCLRRLRRPRHSSVCSRVLPPSLARLGGPPAAGPPCLAALGAARPSLRSGRALRPSGPRLPFRGQRSPVARGRARPPPPSLRRPLRRSAARAPGRPRRSWLALGLLRGRCRSRCAPLRAAPLRSRSPGLRRAPLRASLRACGPCAAAPPLAPPARGPVAALRAAPVPLRPARVRLVLRACGRAASCAAVLAAADSRSARPALRRVVWEGRRSRAFPENSGVYSTDCTKTAAYLCKSRRKSEKGLFLRAAGGMLYLVDAAAAPIKLSAGLVPVGIREKSRRRSRCCITVNGAFFMRASRWPGEAPRDHISGGVATEPPATTAAISIGEVWRRSRKDAARRAPGKPGPPVSRSIGSGL